MKSENEIGCWKTPFLELKMKNTLKAEENYVPLNFIPSGRMKDFQLFISYYKKIGTYLKKKIYALL